MLRSAFLVFIAGWLAWFWIDKPDPRQLRLPGAGDSLVNDLQQAFDLLRAGHADIAYVYLWDAHYLVLSLLGGALLALLYGSVAQLLGRRRMRRLLLPRHGAAGAGGKEPGGAGAGPPATPPTGESD